MILRNVAIRHGRRALATPPPRSLLRTLTTETFIQDREALASSIPNHKIPNHNQESNSIDSTRNQLCLARSLIRPLSPKKAAKKALTQVRNDHRTRQHIKKHTSHLGTVIEPHFEHLELLVSPPRAEDVTLELLMASQSHLGHSTSLWNPMNQRYIFGVRQGVHIISLEETAAHLRRAAKVVEGVAYHGGLILFVGTRKGQAGAVVRAATLAQGCHLFDRWIPGTITNKDQILQHCEIKAVGKDDELLDGFDEKIAEWTALKPDLVVCMNPLENYLLLHECGLNNIPTIGVIDTNADPTWVTYPIPANDDSIRCIQVIAGVLGRAGESGQKKRLEAAKKGYVTWLPPVGLGGPKDEEEEARKAEPKKVSATVEEDELILESNRGYKDPEDEIRDEL